MIKTSRRNNIMEKTEFTQARKKTELLYMLEMMMRNPEAPEEKRNNLKIYIINVDQGPNSSHVFSASPNINTGWKFILIFLINLIIILDFSLFHYFFYLFSYYSI